MPKQINNAPPPKGVRRLLFRAPLWLYRLGLGGLLGDLLGSRTAGGAAPGLASMLDLDGDGNPLDDIMRIVGKATR